MKDSISIIVFFLSGMGAPGNSTYVKPKIDASWQPMGKPKTVRYSSLGIFVMFTIKFRI